MIRMTVSKYRDFLRGKTISYNHVFNRKSVYAVEVLADLAKFCRAHDSTFHPDPRVHALAEGRREVWLRIQQYLEMTAEELMQLQQIKIKARKR